MGYETGLSQRAATVRPPTEYITYPATGDPAVQKLLGSDYEQAARTGLLDLFENGSIPHILSGQIKQTGHRSTVVSGFHHLPSARAYTGEIWPDPDDDPAKGDDTKPYTTLVAIEGHLKQTLRRNPNDRQTRQIPTFNTMFPRALTALEVLELIRLAYFSRDRASEQLQAPNIVISTGIAPETKHSSAMVIKIIWNLLSEKIITAIPKLPPEEEVMARRRYRLEQLALIAGGVILKTKGPGRYRDCVPYVIRTPTSLTTVSGLTA